MRLTVKQLKNREPGVGMAVVDREALGAADLTSGDFVVIRGRDDVVARVWPSDAEDAGRGIVRIDGSLRNAAGAGVDAPDEAARREIFDIHTRDRPPGDGVALDDLAARTDGYVGADIEAVCREAATTAVREYVHGADTQVSADENGETGPAVDEIEVTADHFEQALDAVDPSSEDREFETVDGNAATPFVD